MEDLLNRLRAVNESDKHYRAKVDVDLHVEGVEIESVSDVVIEYELNFESRDWGVKDVDLMLFGNTEIEFQIAGEKAPITIQMHLSDASVSWVAGHRYAPQSVSIVATKDGQIQEAEIIMEYLVPG